MEIGSFLTLHMFVMLVGVVLTANCLTLVLFFSIRMMQGKDERNCPSTSMSGCSSRFCG